MDRKVLHNPVWQKELQQKGFVTMPMFSNEEVKKILDFIDTLQPNDAFKPDGTAASNRSTYHCTFLDTNLDYKKKVASFLEEQFTPYLSKILCNFKYLSINFYIKQPGTGTFQIHQNWPSTELDDTSVSVWCPLVDVSANNGGIQVVPGSHKIVPDIAALRATEFFTPFKDELVKEFLKPVEMKAGEALIFDDSLIHWSSMNNADTPRIAIQMIMVPGDITPLYFHYDVASNMFEKFAIDENFFPNTTRIDQFERPKNVQSLGFVPNPNRELSLEEFKVRMKNGPTRRASIYGQRTVIDKVSDKLKSVFS